MQLFSADITIFQNEKLTFFAPENMKKPSEVALNWPIFFSILPTSLKPAQILNIFHRNLQLLINDFDAET